MRTPSILAALVAGLTAPPALAADKPTPINIVSQGASAAAGYKVDYSVPVSPAFTILGAAPPTDVSAYLGANFSWDVVTTGDKLPVVGASARPYWLTSGREVTLDQYRAMTWGEKRMAATVTSFAIGPQSGDEKPPIGAALGLHTSLLDNGDLRIDPFYTNCSNAVAGKVRPWTVRPVSRPGAPPALPPPPVDTIALAELLRTDALTVETQQQTVVSPARVAGAVAMGRERDEKKLKAAYVAYFQAGGFSDQDIEARYAVLHQAALVPQEDDAAGPFETALQDAPDYAAADAADAKGRAACLAAAKVRFLNNNEWLVGAGARALSPNRQFSNVAYGGVHLWTSYRMPLRRRDEGCNKPNAASTKPEDIPNLLANEVCAPPLANLTLFGRYILGDKVAIAKDTLEEAETTVLGVNLKHDAADGGWAVGATASYNDRNWKSPLMQDENFMRYSLDLSYRIAPGIFLSGQWGTVTHSPRGEDDFTIIRLNFLPPSP